MEILTFQFINDSFFHLQLLLINLKILQFGSISSISFFLQTTNQPITSVQRGTLSAFLVAMVSSIPGHIADNWSFH